MADCTHCGAPLPSGARFCGTCGRPAAPPAAAAAFAPSRAVAPPPRLPAEKNAVLSLLLSIVTGLGQLYNGETAKGATLLIVGVVLFAASVVTIVLFLASFPFWIHGMYDAYQGAASYNLSLRTTGRPPW